MRELGGDAHGNCEGSVELVIVMAIDDRCERALDTRNDDAHDFTYFSVVVRMFKPL